jgi:hypothetical protein
VSEDTARRLTDEALQKAGLADMRPAYRKLLVQLKQADPAAFQEATRRYREDLEPAVSGGDADPISAWLDYGCWLASRIAEGRAMAIDATGRARPFDPSAPDAGTMILHVPDDDRAPAIALAMPCAPSESQRETAELLLR